MQPLIRPIETQDWAAIMRVQSLAYPADFLESEAALRAKQLIEPHVCRVLEIDQQVNAYCLAHAWLAGVVPSLHSTHSGDCESPNLFIHDMAIAPAVAGRGYARQLFNHIRTGAITAGFQSISLVAVQQSAPFWEKQGFSRTTIAIPESYGEDACYMTQALVRTTQIAQ